MPKPPEAPGTPVPCPECQKGKRNTGKIGKDFRGSGFFRSKTRKQLCPRCRGSKVIRR